MVYISFYYNSVSASVIYIVSRCIGLLLSRCGSNKFCFFEVIIRLGQLLNRSLNPTFFHYLYSIIGAGNMDSFCFGTRATSNLIGLTSH